MKKQMIFILLAAVLILGCTNASGPAGPGITIREFSFSPTSLTGAQKTSLSLVVQNTGSMDVKEAYAKIFGFGKESGLWNILPQGEKEVSVKPFGLRAQASFAGNVGEQKKFVWLLQNKDKIPEDMTRTYTANARLCYPYNTTALGRVELMSENEWMSKNSPQHEIIVSQTSAPVRITVLSKQPIINSGQLSLDLLIENTGGGTVAMPGYCEKVFAGGGDVTKTPLNKLNLVVSGLTNKECTTSVGTSNNIFLEKGKSVKVSADCGIGSESAPISAADLKIEMGYDYYVDAKASVMVKGPNEGKGVVTPKLELPVPLDYGTKSLAVTFKAEGSTNKDPIKSGDCLSKVTGEIYIDGGSGDAEPTHTDVFNIKKTTTEGKDTIQVEYKSKTDTRLFSDPVPIANIIWGASRELEWDISLSKDSGCSSMKVNMQEKKLK